MVRVLKSSSSAPKIPSIEIHEPPLEHDETIWRTKMHRIAIEFASTFIGQAIMMQFDKLLWTLEKTTTWISSGKTDSKKSDHLIRPLPWVLFLPTLVALRYARVILSLLSICLGYDEIEVSTMVAWLHQSRRTIRHIVHEAKRNEQKAAVAAATQSHNYNNTSIDCFKRIILSAVSNLSGLIFSTPYTVAVHNNKTSLDSFTDDETKQPHKQQQQQQPPQNNDNGMLSNTDDDSDNDDDRAYQDFLSRTIESSDADADDEDFVPDVNGDDISSSDTDSQSSIATSDMSNDEIDMNRSVEAETSKTSEATEALETDSPSNVDNTNVASDRSEKAAEEDKHHNTDATRNVEIDNVLNQLIDDTTVGNKNVARQNRGGKNSKRHHKNGGAARSHSKAQNNGKHTNGAHSQCESESAEATVAAAEAAAAAPNHHANTFHEFTVTETAADHTTQTD